MRLLSFICLLFVLLNIRQGYSQLEKYADDFILPLRIDPVLSGGFGEPRARHFHMGIDFRTYGSGVPVYSVADGYVSRIAVSPYGYGYALYIDHFNNYTSVYAHLRNFSPEIDEFVKNAQYYTQSFSVDTILNDASLFPVKKGQLVAYSGNTGASEGPHLHFEIRETDSENPVNMLNVIYDIRDNVRPEIYGVVFYPLSHASTINDKNEKLYRRVHRISAGNYVLSGSIPSIGGLAGIGIDYIDRMSGTHNRFGARCLKVFFDNKLIYHSSVNKLSYENQSQKNSVFDYEYLIRQRKHVHKGFREPNNTKTIFETLINDGVFETTHGSIHDIEIQVIDYYDNISKISLQVKGDNPDTEKEKPENMLKYDKDYLFIFEDFRVEIDSGVLFNNMPVSIEKKSDSRFSSRYSVGDPLVFVKSPYRISIYLNEEAQKYKDKLFIACIHNGRMFYNDAEIQQNRASCNPRFFGEFEIRVDTVPPVIRPSNIRNGISMRGRNFIGFRISDDDSGIDSYNLFINDKWVLAEYEPKNNSVRYYFDDIIPQNQNHKLRFEVSDKVNNIAVYECEFYY